MTPGPHAHYYYRDKGLHGLEIARPLLNTFNLVTVRKPHVFGRHQHLNYQLIFTKRGRYRCKLNDEPLNLAAGEILIVKPRDWHEDQCQPPLSYHSINFNLAVLGTRQTPDILFAENVLPSDQVLRGKNVDLWQVIERMQSESKRQDEIVSSVENALLLELFWRLVRAIPRDRLSPLFLRRSGAQAFGERLRRIFDRDIETNLSTAAIAADMGVSVRTLTKRCREIMGLSLMRAFSVHKIRYAAWLIAQSDLPIKEISYRLGFLNQYHFSRVFRRHFGVPPTTYREMPK